MGVIYSHIIWHGNSQKIGISTPNLLPESQPSHDLGGMLIELDESNAETHHQNLSCFGSVQILNVTLKMGKLPKNVVPLPI